MPIDPTKLQAALVDFATEANATIAAAEEAALQARQEKALAEEALQAAQAEIAALRKAIEDMKPGPVEEPANWTVTREPTVYVSHNGDDKNPGTKDKPVRNIKKGVKLLQNGGCLGFERGGVYPGAMILNNLADVQVVGYGKGPRPLLQTSGETSGMWLGKGGHAGSIAVVGLHFKPSTRKPDEKPRAIRIDRDVTEFLIEDCKLEGFREGVLNDTADADSIIVRRTIFTDMYASGAHAQGTYIASAKYARFEECVFHRCGWRENTPGAEPTMFNHAIYIGGNNKGPVDVINCIIVESASHAMQLRTGGKSIGNVMLGNMIGPLIGNKGMDSEVRDNVLMDNPRTSWGIEDQGIGTRITGNLIVNVDGFSIALKGKGGVAEDNLIHDGSSIEVKAGNTERNNILNKPASAYVDPTRRLPDGLLDRALNRAPGTWPADTTAQYAAKYIREGFKVAR